MFRVLIWFLSLLSQVILPANGCAAEKLVGINSALALSQSFPWIAKETGLFDKHNLNFEPVFIQSSAAVTAAMLGGESEIGILGAVGIVRASIQGATDFVCARIRGFGFRDNL
jgi:ABC-type nitrate/sulfonate/bicarbonate transport system substrate-binding protein